MTAQPAHSQPDLHGVLRKPHRGFALVVTLSLMILLTIIAVGLLTLSTISLRNSSHESDLASARANARLSVMMAISQLQHTLGHDQRVTATADLAHPNGLAKWTGVYGNEAVANYSQSPSEIPSNPYKPALLNWLVSGNESVNFESSTQSTDFGKITSSPSGIPYKPTDSVNGIGSNTGDLTIKGERAALLVGAGSVNGAASTSNHVAAPIVGIKDPNSTTMRGGYAYWVGDEGMKARIDLRDNYRKQTSSGDIDNAKAYSFITAQRSGIEMMRRDENASSKIGSDYDPGSKNLDKLITSGEFALLSPNFTDVARSRFHDITAYSKSVIADSYAGGLKQEMGALVYGNAGPADSEPVFTPISAGEFGIPRWGHIRSWAKLNAPHATPPPVMPSSAVRPYSPTQTRFGPVIQLSSLGIGIERVPGSPNQVRLQLFPALVLWNPYTVGIPATNYEVGFRFIPGNPANDIMTVEMAKTTSGPWSSIGSCNLSGGDSAMAAGNGFFRFAVQGSEIPAGEAHVYLAEFPGGVYVPGATKLIRAPDTAPIGHLTRYVSTATSFTYNTATYGTSNPAIRLDCDMGSTQGMTNGDRLEVVLTTPGALSSGYNRNTPVYQALLDMNMWVPYGNRDISQPPTLLTCGLNPLYLASNHIMMEARGNPGSDWQQAGGMNASGRGERNRWIGAQNPIAPYVKRTANEQNLRGGAFSHGNIFTGENTNARLMLKNSRVNNYMSGFGGSPSAGDGNATSAPLIDILPSSTPLMSIGQLQHAQLDPYAFGITYTFGNGTANVNVPRTAQFRSGQVAPPGDSPTSYSETLYDMPWHANRAIWDRYFVSSVPSTLSQSDIDSDVPLPNARMEYVRTNGNRPTAGKLRPTSPDALLESAANLMVKGGFNLNSTSVDAWRAILTGTNQLTVPSTLANPQYSSEPLNAMMPRFSRDVRTTDANNEDGLTNMWSSSPPRKNLYQGNRELVLFRTPGNGSESVSAAQGRLHAVAGELAEKIVAEIRLRGPFLSLGDFVNRKLVSGDEGIRGILQAAIDKMENNKVNPQEGYSEIGGYLSGNSVPNWDEEHYFGVPLSEKGSPAAAKMTMAPKFLSQADVLSTIGPFLSARSDTFTVRGYGEARDASGKVTAKAWCEAVVQRQPDYIDPTDAATVAPRNLTRPANRKLGRRFEMVAFRWLSANEI